MTDMRVLPADEVCACLDEMGERKVRLYERCERCGAFMEADALSEGVARLRELEQLAKNARALAASPDYDRDAMRNVLRAILDGALAGETS